MYESGYSARRRVPYFVIYTEWIHFHRICMNFKNLQLSCFFYIGNKSVCMIELIVSSFLVRIACHILLQAAEIVSIKLGLKAEVKAQMQDSFSMSTTISLVNYTLAVIVTQIKCLSYTMYAIIVMLDPFGIDLNPVGDYPRQQHGNKSMKCAVCNDAVITD